MPPKGIDYSKWDKIECSSSEDDEENLDDEEDFNEQQQHHATTVSSSSSSTIRKFDRPTSVTFGGPSGNASGNVFVHHPTSPETMRQQQQQQQQHHQNRLNDDAAPVSNSHHQITTNANNNNNNNNTNGTLGIDKSTSAPERKNLLSTSPQQSKRPKAVRNGCYIPPPSSTVGSCDDDAAAVAAGDAACFRSGAKTGHGSHSHCGLFWSQSADSVSVGVVLETFTLLDFDKSEYSDDGIDSAVRHWNLDAKSRKKVQCVAVSSYSSFFLSLSSSSSGENDDGSCGANTTPKAKIAITLKKRTPTRGSGGDTTTSSTTAEQTSSTSTTTTSLLLAYDAEPLDPDEFWSVQLLSANELGLSLFFPESTSTTSSNNNHSNNDSDALPPATKQNDPSSVILAVRAVVVELRKKQFQNTSGAVRFWWDRLLANQQGGENTLDGVGDGKIDVVRDIEDRHFVSGAPNGNSQQHRSSSRVEEMKNVWDEAHRMFREKVAARKKQS